MYASWTYLFPRVFQTTEESILGRSEDCLCCQFLEWKLQVDLSVKQVHSEWTYFNCYPVMFSGRLEEFIVETFRVKPSEWLQLVHFIGGYLAYTDGNSKNVESERYSDYFNPMPDISNDILTEKKLKPDNIIGTLRWSEFWNWCFPGNLQLCFVFHYI